MRRAASDLTGFSDNRLFKEVSEGIPLIVHSAIGLDEAAHSLHEQQQVRVSEIIRGFAEEEAAKVLILVDLVRCPRERRVETAKHFYSHVGKRIYATACSYPRIGSFKEFCELVEMESRPYDLDGPNRVDWIFPNSIVAERDQALYVDYVRDITDERDKEGRIRFVPASELGRDFELPSYARLEEMFRVLTEEERAGLLALGWYAKEQVAEWPRIYERAIASVVTLDTGYQIGQAGYWLDGLRRWEVRPRPFNAGQ